MRTAHILIHGRVQGVGFRYWLAGEAEKRGLAGWVRNRHSGSVEAVVCGASGQVRDMLAVCGIGPRFAQVSHIETLENIDEPILGFEIRPTA